MKQDKPEPSLRISVRVGDDQTIKLRLYDAVQFGGPVGLYRVKVGREWMRTDAEKYLFLTPQAALMLAARSAGLDLPEQEPPTLRHKDRVRAPLWDAQKERHVVEKCFASSPPFQGVDGRWRIWVSGYAGTQAVLCDEVERLPS